VTVAQQRQQQASRSAGEIEHRAGRPAGHAIDRQAPVEGDVGAAAAYLLSDAAKNVTGTTLYVDSGYHAMGM